MRASNFFFSLIASISCFSTLGQFKQIAEGPKFEEPITGYAKILQLKNGNTFYAHVTMKDGINIRIYDAGHKEKKETSIQPNYGELNEKMRDAVIAVFEINNNVVFFIYHTTDNLPTLYRIIVDGTTGQIKQQKAIAVIDKEWRVSTFVTIDIPEFFIIKKDPLSDCYAVIVTDFREKDYNKRTQVVHYSGDHVEISKQFFHPANKSEAKPYLLDLVVMGTEKLLGIAIERNDGEVKYSLVDIKKGSLDFSDLDLREGQKVNCYFAFRLNPVSNKVIFMISGAPNTRKTDEYVTTLYMIDPNTKVVQPINDIGLSEKSQNDYKDQFKEKKGYRGMVQDLVVNEDGSFTMLFEDMLIVPNSGMGTGTSLEATAAVIYDKDGRRISDYVIPILHWIFKKSFQPMYHYRGGLGAIELFESNQYKSFTYLDAGNKKYILFNDTEKNNDITRFKPGAPGGTGVGLKGVTKLLSLNPDTDAFMYQLTGEDVIPKREYLFEEKDNIRAMALLNAATYDKINNLYVTLRFDKKTGRGIMANLVWLQLP